MSFVFLVPTLGEKPNGGIRIIYEHANRLSAKGHDVELLHFSSFPGDSVKMVLRKFAEFVRFRLRGETIDWFSFHPDIRRRYHFRPIKPNAKTEDTVIATYFKTFQAVERYGPVSDRVVYLIQGVETDHVDKATLASQWRSAARKVVISKWLLEELGDAGVEAHFVRNAIDTSFFRMTRPVKDRSPSLLFASMGSANKGSAEVVEAIDFLRSRGVALDVVAFGNRDPAEFGLRAPYRFVANPTQRVLRDLYNEAAIFAAASRCEGWGLTLAEAASCGAALVVSDARGHFEFGRPGDNALFYTRGKPEELAEQIEILANDIELRAALVRQAQRDLEFFNWGDASDELERILTEGRPAP